MTKVKDMTVKVITASEKQPRMLKEVIVYTGHKACDIAMWNRVGLDFTINLDLLSPQSQLPTLLKTLAEASRSLLTPRVNIVSNNKRIVKVINKLLLSEFAEAKSGAEVFKGLTPSTIRVDNLAFAIFECSNQSALYAEKGTLGSKRELAWNSETGFETPKWLRELEITEQELDARL